jgi:hypothetical protein
VPDVNVRLVDVWLENESGQRVENVEQQTPIRFNLIVEARHDLEDPTVDFHVVNEDGVWVFTFGGTLHDDPQRPERIAAGQRMRIAGTVENPLLPGRYTIDCWMTRRREYGDTALHVLPLMDFHVFGTKPGAGSIFARTEVETTVQAGP